MRNNVLNQLGTTLLFLAAPALCTQAWAQTPTQISNSTIKASASSNDGHLPAFTLDNSLAPNSRWSAQGDGQWITYDIGSVKTLAHMNIAFHQGDIRKTNIEIKTSTDLSNWKTAFSGYNPSSTLSFQRFDLKASQGRYVRIIGHGNTNNNWNSITEVQLFAAAQSEPVCTGCSSQQELQKYFDVEGLSPYVSTGRLRFDALASKHVTPNGHGWRNELTIKKSLRTAFNKTYERLTAKVSVNLSKGSKTIISQFHAADTGTLVKVYVSDTSESGFSNSISTDGIFDVYVRMKNESGKEQKFSLGSVKSGGSFSLDIVNNYGDVTVSALGTSAYLRVKNDPGAFFKFGNYLQAQDPDTMDQVENSSMFGDFYRKNNITTSIVEFTNLTYVRTK